MSRIGLGLALVAALCVADTASAAWTCTAPGVCTEVQLFTRAEPSVSTPKDWISLSGVKAFRVSVCADSGTLSGAGALEAYLKGSVHPIRNKGLDQPITVTATSCNGAACECQGFPDIEVAVGVGEFAFVLNGLTASAGTTATVKIELVR